ncbi:MAG: hypothetical protein WC314_00990 [Vulcanimicrobiota bacterium]
MYILVDRATGNIITTIGERDFQILKENLVAESSEDFDFYLNEASLQFLNEQGLSGETTEAFAGRLEGRGLDLGWEKETPTQDDLHTGTVVDNNGKPLGGIRVDLLDLGPLETGKLQTERILDWTYSRADGRFALQATREAPGTQLRFSGRGDLVLSVAEVGAIGEQGEFVIQTVTGTVKVKGGTNLPGVSVQLLNWSLQDSEQEDTLGGSLSWGDTDSEGRFAIPLYLPEESGVVVLKLEILAPSGECLYEDECSFDPADGFEIGELWTAQPSADYGEEEPQEAPEERPFEFPLS